MPRFFTLADPEKSEAAARLERLILRLEAQWRAAFLTFVRNVTDPAVLAQLADLLERGDLEGALALIDTHTRAFGAIYPRLFSEAATAEVQAVLPMLGAKVGVAFDPGLPEAAELMRHNQLELVQALTDSQRAAIRQALAGALERGQGPRVMTEALRGAIGLAPQQIEIVANYRRLLETNSARALEAHLRDRRFDGPLERAVEGGEPLSQAKIDQMVERYRLRWVGFRAATIARTETISMLSQAQEAAFAQVMTQAQLRPDQVEQTWWSIDDQRTRDTHRTMRGQVRLWGQPFQSPSGVQLRYPGDPQAPAFEVCNCRCHRTFRVLLDSQRRAA